MTAGAEILHRQLGEPAESVIITAFELRQPIPNIYVPWQLKPAWVRIIAHEGFEQSPLITGSGKSRRAACSDLISISFDRV